MKSGTTIGNNRTGEMLTMLTSEEDSGGALQYYRVHLPAYRPSPPLHYHVAFSEKFTCVEGTLDIYLGRERRHVVLHPRETITAEIGQLHTFGNTSPTRCVFEMETRPAGGVVKAFQLAYGLANDAKAGKDGLPRNLLYRLRFVGISEGFLPGIPLGLQRFVFRAALVSRLTGVEQRIQAYLANNENESSV